MPKNKDHIDLDGWDLFRAAEENRVDVTYACLLRGYDVKAKNETGDTPFEHAARNKSYDVARFLHYCKIATDDQQYA